MLKQDNSSSFIQNVHNETADSSVCEVEIIYAGPRIKSPKQIQSSEDAYKIILPIYDQRKLALKEFFYVFLLNKANNCIGYSRIGIGGLDGVVVNVKEIFQLAILSNASGIILSHNHPSGNLKPSIADIRITEKIKAGSEYFDLVLIDHLIITASSYYSFADDRIL